MCTKTLLLLTPAFLVSFATLGVASIDHLYKPSEVLVHFAPKADGDQRNISERNEILTTVLGARVKRTSHFVPGLTLVQLPQNISVQDAVGIIKNTPGILSTQANYIYKALSAFPSDPRFNELWGMHNTGQTGGTVDADIDAPEAWDITADANTIIIAVIDSGVDYTHPDLNSNVWTNQPELNGQPNVDDDDNGCVDDVYGYDFVNDDPEPADDRFHGTHCAGIIGALVNDSAAVTAVWMLPQELDQLGKSGFRICAAGLGPGNKLAHIHPPVGGFTIMDIALWLAQDFADLALRKSRISPQLSQESRNDPIASIVLGFCTHNVKFNANTS